MFFLFYVFIYLFLFIFFTINLLFYGYFCGYDIHPAGLRCVSLASKAGWTTRINVKVALRAFFFLVRRCGVDKEGSVFL